MDEMACIVVLYNPSKDIINKVTTYTEFFKEVILVDNSIKNIEYLFKNEKIKYISNKRNKGIAFALNVGINKAIDDKFKWVMTLDQDSCISKECVAQLKDTINMIEYNNIALLSANYEPDEYSPQKGIENIHFAITSGTVINTSIYKDVGGFVNEMFIDAVDYEYCYRLVTKGYRLIRNNNALFSHTIGTPTYVKGVRCRNYPAFRYYFIARNNLIVSKMYGNSLPESLNLRKSAKRYIKSTRYEKEKIKKKIFILIAVFDYLLWLLTHKYYCHISKFIK